MKPANPTANPTGSISRRSFVQTAAGVAAGAAAMGWIPAVSHARMKNHRGAADALRIGIIGTGGQGRSHVKGLVDKAKADNVSVRMLCDVYRRNLKRAQDIAKIDDKDCVIEYEKILDNKDIDAVLIATPDHWHVKIAIEAMEAGKDVYVEKPLSHTIEQAIACRNAVRKTGRVLQVGPQKTSENRWWAAGEAIKAGKIGPVVWSQGSYCRNSREGQFNWTIDKDAGPQNAPTSEAYIDWDRWLGHKHGLAEKIPYNDEHFFRFRKFYAYNGGVATDLMYHWLSPLLIAIHGQNGAYPRRVMAGGGQYIEKPAPGNARDIADTMLLTADYDTHSVFLSSVMVNDVGVPEMIRGQQGQLEPTGDGWKLKEQGTWAREFRKANGIEIKEVKDDKGRVRLDPPEGQAGSDIKASGSKDGRDHVENWIDSMRKKATPNCNVELGCAVMVAIKMGVESYRQSKTFSWDAKSEKVVG
jgi:predicted dehydrogenase